MLKFYGASLVLEKQGLQEVAFIKHLPDFYPKGNKNLKDLPLWHKGLKPSYTNF